MDMESATEDKKSGRGATGLAYILKLATVTIPFKTERLNLVSSMYFLRNLPNPTGTTEFINNNNYREK